MAESRAKKTQQEQEQQPAEDAAKDAVKDTEVAEEDEAYPKDFVIGGAVELTGYQPHEVAGALEGVQKKNVTVDEAKAAVKAWLESPQEV